MCHTPQAIVDKKDFFPPDQIPVEAFPVGVIATELAEWFTLVFLAFHYVFAQSLAARRMLNLLR